MSHFFKEIKDKTKIELSEYHEDRTGRRRGRGRGRGRERGRGRGRGRDDSNNTCWIPCTKLGRLVVQEKIKCLEQIFLHSIPIKEYQITDHLLGERLVQE